MQWLGLVVSLWLCVSGCQVTTSGGSVGRARGTGAGVSSGERRQVTMPDLFLMTRDEAEAALARAGFERPANLDTTSLCGSTVEKTVVELGRVCHQMPPPGRVMTSTIPVSIRVQTENPWHGELGGGRRWFLMPELVGKQVDEARAIVRARGFTSKEVQISFVDEPGCAPNVVCKTLPEGLSRTDTTSDKLFYVGRPPSPAPTATKPEPGKSAQPAQPVQPAQPSMGDLF